MPAPTFILKFLVVMTFSPQILTKFYNKMITLNPNFNLYMKMKGSMLCSGRNVAGWRRANAQPSIFSTSRKENYNKKTISELRLQDKSTTCNEQEILDQIEAYFKNLYSSENTFSQEDYEEFIHNLEIPRLSNEDRDSLEGMSVVSPTSRFAYIEVVSPTRPSRFAYTVWVDSPTVKSFRLHLQLEIFCEDWWKSLPIVNQGFIFDCISS